MPVPAGQEYGGHADLRGYAKQLMETSRVEYVDEGVILVMAPAGYEHRAIVESIARNLYRVMFTSQVSREWAVYSEDFQWDLPDGSGRFYVPDIVVIPRPLAAGVCEAESIVLIAEVTSPKSPDTVLNDRETKPREFAKAGVPVYLLVDQDRREWILHALAKDWPGYRVVATGPYGEDVPLPEPLGFSLPTDDWPVLQ